MQAMEALNLLEELEERFARMYGELMQKFQDNEEVSAVFYQMHLDEKSHADVVRMQKNIVETNRSLFKNVELNISEVSKSMDIAAYISQLSKEDLGEICRQAYMVESSSAELYTFTALAKANKELRGLLLNLGAGFSEHLELIESLMMSLNIEFRKVEGLKLRHPRVHFTSNVLVNDKIRMKAFDISESGMFLLTDKNLSVGIILNLSFLLSRQRIIVSSMVQNVEKNRGVGVRFLDLRPQQKALIKDYINNALQKQNWKTIPVLLSAISMTDVTNLRMYSDALIEEGFAVTFTKGFVETVLYLNSHTYIENLVLSMDSADEMNMKFLQFIQENKLLSNLHTIILYNNYDPEFKKQVEETGIVSAFLPKSAMTPKKLARELKSLY